MTRSLKTSFIQLLSIAVLPVILISCELTNNPQDTPSSLATLSDIRIVERPNDVSETDDYFIAELEPEFHSDTLFYAVTVDTAFVLGIQSVPTSSEASISVSLDGETISAKEWTDSEVFFTCPYESGTDTWSIEISVTAGDGTSRLSYTISVRYTYDSLQVPPDSLDTPSSDATLTDIQTIIVRPYKSEDSTIVDLQPDFNPEIHSYSVQTATGNLLGIRPVTTSPEACISVVTTWEGRHLTAEKHDGSDVSYYWVNKPSGNDYTTIKISVIAGDKKSMLIYEISVSYYTDTLSEPPANCATLSDMLTVARYGSNSYHYAMPVTPAFRPDSLSYSVELDSALILGVQPAPSSPKASTSVLLDGVAINPEVWPDSSEFFTCTPPPETNNRTIEITVTAEDKETSLTYQIIVKRKKTYTPCYLDDMPMAKWISDTMVICGSRCGYARYFGFEEVQPSPKFASNSHEYLVHIGDFNFFGFAPKSGGYIATCSMQSTTEIFRRMYDLYYYLKRPNGSKETDTVKIAVTSDSL